MTGSGAREALVYGSVIKRLSDPKLDGGEVHGSAIGMGRALRSSGADQLDGL